MTKVLLRLCLWGPRQPPTGSLCTARGGWVSSRSWGVGRPGRSFPLLWVWLLAGGWDGALSTGGHCSTTLGPCSPSAPGWAVAPPWTQGSSRGRQRSARCCLPSGYHLCGSHSLPFLLSAPFTGMHRPTCPLTFITHGLHVPMHTLTTTHVDALITRPHAHWIGRVDAHPFAHTRVVSLSHTLASLSHGLTCAGSLEQLFVW